MKQFYRRYFRREFGYKLILGDIMDRINCEICGGEMEYRRDKTTQGWYCTNCEWNVITSFIEPIYEDATTYNVFSIRNIQVGAEQLKAISKIKK